MSDGVISLRGHHVLCLLGFRGLGYNEAFVRNMTQVVRAVQGAPQRTIRLTNHCDDLCAACPHQAEGECRKKNGSESKVRKADNAVLCRLGFTSGRRVTARRLYERVAESVAPDNLGRELCRRCGWRALGYCAEGLAALRAALDAAGRVDTAIMSYAAKFASAFYGPFREAAHSAPRSGDRSGYQLPPANRREAVHDALLDEAEGADWLMVKPALPYLDVLAELRREARLPIAAYQVSGEYAMIKFAARAGAIDERQTAVESVLSIRRAGADAVITYFAEDLCRWIGE